MSRRLYPRLVHVVALCALLFAGAAAAGTVTEISGAGATFPYPVYSKWAEAYRAKTGIRMNYQSIGSGGGIKQIKARTVDFGASDAPMKPEELEKYGLLQWPQIMGGVVPVVNLPGLRPGEVKLPNEVLADIFIGKIKRWNDPAIQAANAGVKLPDMAITVVHRADGSGTTFIFTNYLSKVSAAWKAKVGFGKAVSWPAGVGAKGNEGVASYVRRIRGGVGYVEYAYALQNKMAYVRLRNKAGHYVSPSSKTFQSAAANADWKDAPGYYLILTDQPGADSWPITGASFILVYKTQAKPEMAREVLKFYDWAYHHGTRMAESLDYVPMPASVVRMVEQTWSKEIKSEQGHPVWTGAGAN
ncbi:MAG: phosphate ABC transporter substrate-binding protein PstS [Chromatiales bacterium 21-64-14]|nr:MAG: phosphate ABC transporter substrate-binding protein PstS [Chromatiales bacterium 21-64-14]HQU14839.1 phosphate ABC transporter substrate-binding protein PstS [Gammaproteobacteria bacterium]